jgi:hypothetical protein
MQSFRGNALHFVTALNTPTNYPLTTGCSRNSDLSESCSIFEPLIPPSGNFQAACLALQLIPLDGGPGERDRPRGRVGSALPFTIQANGEQNCRQPVLKEMRLFLSE